MILAAGKLSTMKAPERSSEIIKAAIDQEKLHTQYIGEETYSDALKGIRNNLQHEHFKAERVGKFKENVHAKMDRNKKLNNIQKQTGVDRTAATLGLLPYSAINKNKGHEMPLKEELIFRGVSFEDSTGFMTLKKLLMSHELERVSSSEKDIAK